MSEIYHQFINEFVPMNYDMRVYGQFAVLVFLATIGRVWLGLQFRHTHPFLVGLVKWTYRWFIVGVLISTALDFECVKAVYLESDLPLPIACRGDVASMGYWQVSVLILSIIIAAIGFALYGIWLAFVWIVNLESTIALIFFGVLFVIAVLIIAIIVALLGRIIYMLISGIRYDDDGHAMSPSERKSGGFLKGFADSFNEDTSSSQSSSPAREPYRVPKQKTQTYAPPQKPEKYFVQVLKPGQYKYQNLTGGDSNLINATRRMEQHMDARHGTDSKNNASKAKYRIVNQDGKVQ